MERNVKVTIAENDKKSNIERIFSAFVEGFGPFFLTVGILFSCCTIFQMDVNRSILVIGAVVGILFCVAVKESKHGTWLGTLGIAAAVLFLFFWKNTVINGCLALYNHLGEVLGNRSSILLSPYQLIAESTSYRDMELVLGIIALLLFFVGYGLQRLESYGVLLFWIPLSLYSFCSDHNADTVGKMLVLFGIFFQIIALSFYGKRMWNIPRGYQMVLFAGGLLALLTFGGARMAELIFPVDQYEEQESLVQIKEKVQDKIEEFRYGKADVNTLPKGNMEKADTWEGTEDTALKVTMTEPESLYLRGFVGSIYKNNLWTDLEKSTYYEAKDTFYWLHKSGFYGNRQMAYLREKLKETELNNEKITVTVENVAADREYLYTPYEMITLDAEVEENNGDSYARSKKLRGEESYTLSSYGNLVKDFPQMAAEEYLYVAEKGDTSYEKEESHYNAFVYENYLELSSSLKILFKEILGYDGDTKEGHINYYSAIQNIRNYLEKAVICQNSGEELPEGEDFVTYFLTKSKAGNSMHYATAAAMMFRYYGIPSRYVEGYLITPEQVENLSGESTIEVPGSNGHAWTEIYVDGLGWVPVEMYPDACEQMETPDFTKGLEADSTITLEEPEEEKEEETKQDTSDLKKKLVGFFLQVGKILLAILLFLDACFVLFFIYSMAGRWIVMYRRKKAFTDRDNRQAVRSMTAYSARLMPELTEWIDEEQRKEYQEIYQIGEKAAFSLHPISEEERDRVKQCKDALLNLLKKKKGWYEKWVLKYIEKLY